MAPLGKLQKPCSLEEYLPSVDSNIAFISGRIEFVSISASHEVGVVVDRKQLPAFIEIYQSAEIWNLES